MAHCFIEKKFPNMLILKFLCQRINATSIYCTFFRQGSTLNILIGKKNDILVPLAQQLSIKILLLLFTIFTGYLKLIQGG